MTDKPHLYVVNNAPLAPENTIVEREAFVFLRVADLTKNFDEIFLIHNGNTKVAAVDSEGRAALLRWVKRIADHYGIEP